MYILTQIIKSRFQQTPKRLKQSVSLALLACLSATSNAALVETTAAEFDTECCLSDFYNTRFGDNIVGSDADNVVGDKWEVGTTKDGFIDNSFDQHAYVSGTSQSFTLTNNTTLGLLTYTLGTDKFELDYGDNVGWETIGIDLKIRDNILKGLRKVTLTDLAFQSTAIGIDVSNPLTNSGLLVSNSGGSELRKSALFIEDSLGRYLGDFTLTGNLTFEWQDSGDGAFEDPTGPDLRFRVGVANKVTGVPIPAAAWLLGSALAGLGWMRRKPTT